eukprot:CAMPEP_0183744930 /NCGR_PEP_ID=MMETSP0737-20130205/65979_1 /TAXON_ID=385413 /ORGANISM="Thalassiosira miniscula, Strain CCMP1093" /LENGTH=610 /DNA_ID=CAMNT_0025980583 /DNA_START=150 /DNA_END=1984 /DNA_ORIENTATION=-
MSLGTTSDDPSSDDPSASSSSSSSSLLEKHRQAVRSTWTIIEESFVSPDEFAQPFYDRLFETYPEVKPMFDNAGAGGDFDMNEQYNKFFDTVGMAVDYLNDVENTRNLKPMLEDLGRKHAVAWNVQREQYDAVGECLLWALKTGLKKRNAWNSDVADAWEWAYLTIARAMADAGEEAAREKTKKITRKVSFSDVKAEDDGLKKRNAWNSDVADAWEWAYLTIARAMADAGEEAAREKKEKAQTKKLTRKVSFSDVKAEARSASSSSFSSLDGGGEKEASDEQPSSQAMMTPTNNHPLPSIHSLVRSGVYTNRNEISLRPRLAALLVVDIQKELSTIDANSPHVEYAKTAFVNMIKNTSRLLRKMRSNRAKLLKAEEEQQRAGGATATATTVTGSECIFTYCEALTDDSRDASLDYVRQNGLREHDQEHEPVAAEDAIESRQAAGGEEQRATGAAATATTVTGSECIFTYCEALTDDSRDASLDYKLSGALLANLPSPSRPAAFVPGVEPAKGKDVCLPKTSCSVFQSTNLEYVLKNLGVEQLILCGQPTDQSVESAVRDAADRGYLVTVAVDACGAQSEANHERGLAGMRGFSRQLTTDEVIGELSNGGI